MLKIVEYMDRFCLVDFEGEEPVSMSHASWKQLDHAKDAFKSTASLRRMRSKEKEMLKNGMRIVPVE